MTPNTKNFALMSNIPLSANYNIFLTLHYLNSQKISNDIPSNKIHDIKSGDSSNFALFTKLHSLKKKSRFKNSTSQQGNNTWKNNWLFSTQGRKTVDLCMRYNGTLWKFRGRKVNCTAPKWIWCVMCFQRRKCLINTGDMQVGLQ